MKIILVNAISKQKIVYLPYPSHSILNYGQLLRIIKIFQRSLKPQNILIQYRNSDGWRYIHHQFSINVAHVQEELHVRYKIYKESVLTPDDRKIINKQVDLCARRLKIYKNIDTNIIDFNFFWASPFEKEILNYNSSDPKAEGMDLKELNLIDWKLRTNGYFKQLGEAIKKMKKKALLYINTFNSECFKYRTEYQIVYIVCHTEKEQNGGDQKFYLVGELNGALNKIYVQDFYKMLEEKRIQLLILYTSCMDEHIKLLKENKNISSIILINQSPLYEQKQILSYMKQLFQNLLKGQSIKRAHELSVQKILSEQQNKIILIEKEDKKFQFKDGELQGDNIYLKGFTNKNKLVSNRILLIELLRTFCLDENNLDCSTPSFKIFNAYNEQCSDNSIFIPEIKCQLIKRKLFKEVIIQTSLGWQTVNFKPRDSETLYILFGDKFSPVQIKKLQKLNINALLLTNQDLNIKKYDPNFNFSPIQPLNKNESLHFLKYHRKLTKNMEQKVEKFMYFTWKENLRHLYCPLNFDYNALMSIIAQFNIANRQSHSQYENFKLFVRKLSQQRFNDYLLIMIIINHSHQNQKPKLLQIIKNLNFYKELENMFPENINNHGNFLQLNKKYFRMIYQDFFHEIYPHLAEILLIFVRQTFKLDFKEGNSTRKSIWFYEATTLTKKSQISILLKRSKGKVKKNENIQVSSDVKYFLRECDGYSLINTGLNIAKIILSFFDIFDSKVNQNKHPTQQLLLCLLMVNNAVIYRKSTQVLKITQGKNGNMEIVFQHKKKKQVVLNQEKDETEHYFEQDQEESQQYENKKKQRFLKSIYGFLTTLVNQKQDSRLYSEEDFLIKVDCLTRRGLLYILSKIRNKLDESTQLLAACNSLAIQLEIQPGYEGKAFDQDNLSVLLKQSQQAMDKCGRNDLAVKYRIGYDILMCLILVNTRCGREKMNQYIWQKINHHQKEIFYRQILQIETPATRPQIYFEAYLEHLCQSRQMHQQLLEHMRNLRLFQSQEQIQVQISKQYYILLQMWSQCNEYIKNLQINNKSSSSFSKLLKLKKDLSQKLATIQYTQQFHVFSMLCTFADYVANFLTEISYKLVIILTDKSLNLEQIIQKCDIDENQLTIVDFTVNPNEDINMLQQVKCKFLLLSLSNASIFEEYAEKGKVICSISCKFILVCDNQIGKKMYQLILKNREQKKYMISYNIEKDKLEKGRSNIIMVLLSLHIVKQIVEFKLEIQEQVYRYINFILEFNSSHNEKDQLERQQRQENATFSMIQKIVNKLKKNLKLHCQKYNQQNLSLTDVDFFINYKKSMVKLGISSDFKQI